MTSTLNIGRLLIRVPEDGPVSELATARREWISRLDHAQSELHAELRAGPEWCVAIRQVRIRLVASSQAQPDEIAKAWTRALVRTIRAALARPRDDVAVFPDRRAAWAALLPPLGTGTLPWWAPSILGIRRGEDAIPRLVEEAPAAAPALLLRWEGADPVGAAPWLAAAEAAIDGWLMLRDARGQAVGGWPGEGELVETVEIRERRRARLARAPAVSRAMLALLLAWEAAPWRRSDALRAAANSLKNGGPPEVQRSGTVVSASEPTPPASAEPTPMRPQTGRSMLPGNTLDPTRALAWEPDADESATNGGDAGPPGPGNPAGRGPGHAPETSERPPQLLCGYPTAFAGLLFLLLRVADDPLLTDESPFTPPERLDAFALGAIAATLTGLPAEDRWRRVDTEGPLRAVFAGLSWPAREPGATLPTGLEMAVDEALRRIAAQCPKDAVWIEDHAFAVHPDLTEDSIAPSFRPLAALLLRPGRIEVSDTSADIFLRLRDVDLPLRLGGFDVDPGWVPFVRRILHFHYSTEFPS